MMRPTPGIDQELRPGAGGLDSRIFSGGNSNTSRLHCDDGQASVVTSTGTAETVAVQRAADDRPRKEHRGRPVPRLIVDD